jgi:uncharacterized protein (DUF433 family)
MHTPTQANRGSLPKAAVKRSYDNHVLPRLVNAAMSTKAVKEKRQRCLEHGHADDPRVECWQERLKGLEHAVFGGRHLNRRISQLITQAGFEIERIEHAYLKDAPKFAGPHLTLTRQAGGCSNAPLLLKLAGFGCILVSRGPGDMSALQTPVVHSDPEIMSGTPVFVGTRVPFQTLIDYLEAGQPLSEFLEDFPTVSKEQAIAALEQAKDALLARADPA